MRTPCLILIALAALAGAAPLDAQEPAGDPLFSRHGVAVFSRLGCSGGSCHGAVQGKNGFRLSLFGAKPATDFDEITRDDGGRRINRLEPEASLLLLKPTMQVEHGGGKVMARGSREYEILKSWITGGAKLDDVEKSRMTKVEVTPREQVLKAGESVQLKVDATFADGSHEDVTALCSFESRDQGVASIDMAGKVTAMGVGDAVMIVRFRGEPAMMQVIIPRIGSEPFPDFKPHNFIDEHVLAKLKRLNVPPVDLCDDATFLRRVRLDVTGQLPTPDEVTKFLADSDPQKRSKQIDELLNEPGYAALWTLKFCDLLKASDYGVYADGLAEHYEAPRFIAWIRKRMEENTPYDELAARTLTATSREGRNLQDWSKEVIALQDGYTLPRKDLEVYSARKSLDIYWQRKEAVGVPGALQVAHSFLGLRLECAQCHRHPHDVWQQDDLLSFANFFTRVRKVGFEGDNEKKYPEQAALFKQLTEDGKKLEEESKKLKESQGKQSEDKAKQAKNDADRLKNEIRRAEEEATQFELQVKNFPEKAGELEPKIRERREMAEAKKRELEPLEKTIAENDKLQQEIRDMERRGKSMGDDIAKRILHGEVMHLTGEEAAKRWAFVESPLGSQKSEEFRLLGHSEKMELSADQDPREKLTAWMRDPSNPFFAKAIVNRVWAHYFGRGIIDPPDQLSPLNPPTHPELLDELCKQFIANKYDLKWLHRTILNSRTYQQSSIATAANEVDRANYAYFYFRRLPAEVLLDALNQTTGTNENFDMKYWNWPDGLKTVELPYAPKNDFVIFMLEQFGRPARNASVQCDCERQGDASMLQVLSFANHPRVQQKIADPAGRVASVIKEIQDPAERIKAIYLSTLSRPPDEQELTACQQFLAAAESPEKGLQGVLWSLLNTKEFVLQH